MNDADTNKLYDALSIAVNLEAHLTNFAGRSARANKAWTGWLKTSKPAAQSAADMKAALAALGKLMKDVKVVIKDLDKATRAASDKKSLANYPTGKAYRDTVLVKQLASLRAWDQNGAKFLASMNKVVAPFPFPKPSRPPVDETVTYESVKNVAHYYDEMTKALAKLG